MPNRLSPGPVGFLGLSEIDVASARFVVIPAPYEFSTYTRKGTRYGPLAILGASRQLERFDEEVQGIPSTAGIYTLSSGAPGPTPEASLDQLSRRLEPFVERGAFVVTLGGDHAVSEAPVRVHARRYPGLSVLHIEAHAGMRESFERSAYHHRCVTRRISQWAPVVQVGVRSFCAEEWDACSSGRVKTYGLSGAIEKGLNQVIEELTPEVYVSIGLDGFDPSVIPGVADPVPGGLSWREGLQLLRKLVQKRNVVGADVVELCPVDGRGISEITASKLVHKMMAYVWEKEQAVSKKRVGKVRR